MLRKVNKTVIFVLDLTNSVALGMFGINNSTNVKVCTALDTSEYILKERTIFCTCIKR